MENSIEIIVGTYDEFLLGYKVDSSKGNTDLRTLIPTFSMRPHAGSIRSLAIGGKFLASGGMDDKICIYDMESRKEINLLLHHCNAVNALTFTPDCSHLLSGASDGRMCVTRVGNWIVGAEWMKAHAGCAVTNIACHSSSKLAMSLGSDFTLRTWNLVTGRCAFVTNLKTKRNLQNIADCLQYSPESKYFTMTGNRILEIWSIFEARIIKETSFLTRPTSVCWLTENNLVVGLDDGNLVIISVDSTEIQYVPVNKSRVKSIAYLNNNLVTASSNGDIIVWSFDLKTIELKKIAFVNIGCRATCLALLDLNQFDENYQLNQVSDVLADEEGEDEEEVPLKKGKQNKTGSVTTEYDNNYQIDSDSSSSSNEQFKINLKTKRTTRNSINTIRTTRKKNKNYVIDDSFSSSDDEPKAKSLRKNTPK